MFDKQPDGDRMTVHEAERLAALWCAGQPLDDLPQWRTAMQLLMREIADTRAALLRAPALAHAEFEVKDEDGFVVWDGDGPREEILREALHYAMIAGEDGPVTVFEVLRLPVKLDTP